MKKILIVAPYCSLPGEVGFNRFCYLAEMLASSYDVTLLTSSFRHFDKKQRKNISETSDFKIKMIHEPGYKRNVSLKRCYSHWIFCKNFEKWIWGKSFDLVYSAFPLIQTNIVLGKIKKTDKFKLIIDIQDVWPESFSAFLPFIKSIPSSILPFSLKANRAYKAADALIAVSNSYLSRATKVNPFVPAKAVYIGSDFKVVKKAVSLKMSSSKYNLMYIGTLSHSYDIETIVKAVDELHNSGISLKLHIFGEGYKKEKILAMKSSAIKLHGCVAYAKIFSYLKSCDVAVNCIKSYAPQSVTNKLSDYLAVGVPVLNSQENIEVLNILKNNVITENYIAGNVESAKKAIKAILNRASGHKKASCIMFDRSNSYRCIVNVVSELLS